MSQDPTELNQETLKKMIKEEVETLLEGPFDDIGSAIQATADKISGLRAKQLQRMQSKGQKPLPTTTTEPPTFDSPSEPTIPPVTDKATPESVGSFDDSIEWMVDSWSKSGGDMKFLGYYLVPLAILGAAQDWRQKSVSIERAKQIGKELDDALDKAHPSIGSQFEMKMFEEFIDDVMEAGESQIEVEVEEIYKSVTKQLGEGSNETRDFNVNFNNIVNTLMNGNTSSQPTTPTTPTDSIIPGEND